MYSVLTCRPLDKDYAFYNFSQYSIFRYSFEYVTDVNARRNEGDGIYSIWNICNPQHNKLLTLLYFWVKMVQYLMLHQFLTVIHCSSLMYHWKFHSWITLNCFLNNYNTHKLLTFLIVTKADVLLLTDSSVVRDLKAAMFVSGTFIMWLITCQMQQTRKKQVNFMLLRSVVVKIFTILKK